MPGYGAYLLGTMYTERKDQWKEEGDIQQQQHSSRPFFR